MWWSRRCRRPAETTCPHNRVTSEIYFRSHIVPLALCARGRNPCVSSLTCCELATKRVSSATCRVPEPSFTLLQAFEAVALSLVSGQRRLPDQRVSRASKAFGSSEEIDPGLGGDPFHKDLPTSISSLRPMIRTENAVATAIFVLSNVGYPVRLFSVGYPLEIISMFALRSTSFPVHARHRSN